MIVVIMHGWGVAAESRLPSHFLDLAIYQWLLAFDAGRIGVVAFFCISGYLIPFTMHGSRIAGLFSFAIRRSSRILPAYLISIPLTMLAIWLAEGRLFDSRTILLNLFMIPRLLGSESISGVYWTLEIEVLFYTICAALFFVGAIRKPSWLLAVSIAGFLAYLGLPSLTRYILPQRLLLEPEHLGSSGSRHSIYRSCRFPPCSDYIARACCKIAYRRCFWRLRRLFLSCCCRSISASNRFILARHPIPGFIWRQASESHCSYAFFLQGPSSKNSSL